MFDTNNKYDIVHNYPPKHVHGFKTEKTYLIRENKTVIEMTCRNCGEVKCEVVPGDLLHGMGSTVFTD